MDAITQLFDTLARFQDGALLLLRIVVGFVFIVASYNKSRNVRKVAERNRLPLIVAYGLTVTEFVSGIGLILGIFAKVAALLIMVVMTGSMSFHIFKWKSPYWAQQGGWEYDLMLFTMALVILTTGGGGLVLYAL